MRHFSTILFGEGAKACEKLNTLGNNVNSVPAVPRLRVNDGNIIERQYKFSELTTNIFFKTVKTISQQYKELWKIFEEEQQINQDMSANRIVEKCVEIMQLQVCVGI